jgi:hypothetical protein
VAWLHQAVGQAEQVNLLPVLLLGLAAAAGCIAAEPKHVCVFSKIWEPAQDVMQVWCCIKQQALDSSMTSVLLWQLRSTGSEFQVLAR